MESTALVKKPGESLIVAGKEFLIPAGGLVTKEILLSVQQDMGLSEIEFAALLQNVYQLTAEAREYMPVVAIGKDAVKGRHPFVVNIPFVELEYKPELGYKLFVAVVAIQRDASLFGVMEITQDKDGLPVVTVRKETAGEKSQLLCRASYPDLLRNRDNKNTAVRPIEPFVQYSPYWEAQGKKCDGKLTCAGCPLNTFNSLCKEALLLLCAISAPGYPAEQEAIDAGISGVFAAALRLPPASISGFTRRGTKIDRAGWLAQVGRGALPLTIAAVEVEEIKKDAREYGVAHWRKATPSEIQPENPALGVPGGAAALIRLSLELRKKAAEDSGLLERSAQAHAQAADAADAAAAEAESDDVDDDMSFGGAPPQSAKPAIMFADSAAPSAPPVTQSDLFGAKKK